MSRLSLTLFLVPLALFIAACANPTTDKPKATTNEAVPIASTSVGGEKYAITPETSKIEFVGSQIAGSHSGSFTKFSGVIDFPGAPEKSTVTVNIDTSSITADDPKLTAHLKSADFFDVAKFPGATFTSSAIKAGGDKGATHTVTGNLQMHGVTKSITFPATIVVSPDVITVESSFAINRKDFEINYAGPANNLINNDVLLTLHVKGTKSK